MFDSPTNSLPPPPPTSYEVRYFTTADGSLQPAMFHSPRTTNSVSLMVALHTWSNDYKQDMHREIELWAIRNGWAYIHPDFRGPNIRPEATGSEFVVKDIVSAVEFAKKNAPVDPRRIYRVGTSGGGHANHLQRRP